MKRLKIFFVTLLLILVLMVLATGVSAAETAVCPATNTWTGIVDTAWTNSGNWSEGEVPCITTSVVIPASASPNFPVASGFVGIKDLTVDSGASFDLNGQTLIVTGTLINNGTLIDRRTISSTDLPFGTCFFCAGGYAGLLLSRDTSGVNDPGVVEVTIKGNQGSCDSGNSTIGRCFNIQPTETNNISIDAIFIFDPNELNGLTCNQLQIYHFSGGVWSLAGSHFLNDCEETVLSPDYAVWTNDITDFSPFGISSGVPTAVSLLGVNAGLANSQLVIFGVVGFVVLALVASIIFAGRKRSRA